LFVTQLRRVFANRWARYGITLALLGAVLYKVNLNNMARAAGSARPQYLLFALLLTGPFLYFKALRWHRMLAAAGVQATFAEATVSLVGGMGVALVTPARLGELVRAAYLRDPQKLKIAALVLVDKGFDVLVLAWLSIAGAWVLLGAWAGLGFAVLSALGLLAVYQPAPLIRLVLRLPVRASLQEKIERTADSLRSLSPASATSFLTLTLLSFIVVLLQFGIILLSWHSWSLEIVFFTFPLVVLTNVLPITIGGLGVRETAAAVLLAHYGVSQSHAVLAALLMFAINTALPGLVGALVLPFAGRSTASTSGLVERP
jgi:glycosyltransferase 2 family protein